MMLSCEAPLSWMKEVSKHIDYEYALAHHLLEDKDYVEHFKQALYEGKIVYLDNSAFELGESFSIKKLMDAYNLISTSFNRGLIFIIAPDVLGDREANHKSIMNFLDAVPQINISEIWATVQGSTLQERIKSYEDLKAEGFSRFTVPSGWHKENGKMIREPEETRVEFFQKVKPDNGSVFHLLGCTDLSYFEEYKKSDAHIVSMDTSYPIAMALQRQMLLYKSEKPSIKINDTYLREEMNEDEKQLVIDNIKMLKEIIK